MSNELALKESEGLKQYYRNGNLIGLSDDQKDAVLVKLCERYGLDLILSPFAKIDFRGVEKFYLTASGTDQIAAQQKLTREIVKFEIDTQLGLVRCEARVTNSDKTRSETSLAFYPVTKYSQVKGADGKIEVKQITLQGEELANALMKSVTKAFRRATLSFVGLAGGEVEEGAVPASSGQYQTAPAPVSIHAPVVEKQPAPAPVSIPAPVVEKSNTVSTVTEVFSKDNQTHKEKIMMLLDAKMPAWKSHAPTIKKLQTFLKAAQERKEVLLSDGEVFFGFEEKLLDALK